MNKIKINSGLASVLLLASFFLGWETLLFVVLFMLLFCELNDTIKGVMVKVLSFFVGLALFQLLWGLITDAYPLLVNVINNFIDVINCYVDNPITIEKLQLYILHPIDIIISTADSIVNYLIVLFKFTFIISVLANKVMKENGLTKFINSFIDKVVNFVNGIELGKVDVNHPEVNIAPVRAQMATPAAPNVGVPLGSMPTPRPEEKPVVPEEKREVKPPVDVPVQTPVNPMENNQHNNGNN